MDIILGALYRKNNSSYSSVKLVPDLVYVESIQLEHNSLHVIPYEGVWIKCDFNSGTLSKHIYIPIFKMSFELIEEPKKCLLPVLKMGEKIYDLPPYKNLTELDECVYQLLSP